MKIGTRNAHPKDRGRWRTIVNDGSVMCISASVHGGGSLPDDTDCVSLVVRERGCDGTEAAAFSIAFSIEDNPDDIDQLIGKLTDLRAHQKRRKGIP